MPAERERVAGLREMQVREVVLDGRALDLVITGKTMSVALLRTINGASTVTIVVHDRDHAIQRSGVLDRAVDLRLPADDGTALWFRLASDSSDDRGVLTLVFESRVWARLADKDRPRSMLRRKVTAAQFLKALVSEVKAERIPFICRQLNVRQRIAEVSSTEASTPRSTRDRGRAKGFAPGARITVKGQPASSQQRRVLAGCLEEADDLGASGFVMVGVVMAVTQESLAGEQVQQTGNDDTGIYQQGRPWVSLQGSKQPGPSTRAFLVTGPTAWQKVHGTIRTTSGNLEQLLKRVQGSVGGYAPWEQEARRTVAAFGSGDAGSIPSDGDRDPDVADYRFRRGQDGRRETTTACGLRLAMERNWRFFESGGAIYFDSDETLLRSRPRMTVTPTSEGLVALPTHSRDVGHDVQEVGIKYRVRGWGAPPGSVVELAGWGAAKDGRWLVQDVGKDDIRSGTVNITLTRAVKAKLEPAPEERQRETGGTAAFSLPSATGGSSKGSIAGSPKRVIDTVVLPIARTNGVARTIAQNDAANAVHGPTSTGGRSDHQGPPDRAWAADLPAVGAVGDRLAAELAREFSFGSNGAGSYVRKAIGGYSVQILWKVEGHYTHVHIGIQKI